MNRIFLIILLASVIAAGAVVDKAEAQSGVTWTSEIFNNPYLTGPAVLTRRDNSVAFNWGTASPGANVPADHFSARIATDAHFPGGTYRFYIRADDAINLYVDFRSYINTWANARPDQLLTVDIPLTSGTHHIQIDYLEVTNNAFIYVSWADLATNPSGPNFPAPVTPVGPGTGGQWTAQYFNNISLSGTPSVVATEGNPSRNWGTNAPNGNIQADQFSARWSSIQYLDGSAYQINVRADDGVRVSVDGAAYINEWHSAGNRVYSANLTLPAGNHTFVVEYYEEYGLAFVEFSLARVSASPAPSVPGNNGGATAVVTTSTLNVRNAPNAATGAVIARVNRGQVFNVLARTGDNSWWQINANGIVGWVSGQFVSVSNAHLVPVVNAPSTPVVNVQPTAYSLRTITTLNIRSAPGTNYSIVGVIPQQSSAQIIARNASNTWWKVLYGGTVGWVSSLYIVLPADINYNTVPLAQ